MAVDTLARAIAAGKVPVTAYEYAVQKGYTGTEEEFAADMGNSATNATNAATSASEAAASAASAVAAATNFAPAYSSSATYAVGDHVLYEGGYYVCNTAITTAEAWTAAHWTATKVGPEITELKTQLSDVRTFMVPPEGTMFCETVSGQELLATLSDIDPNYRTYENLGLTDGKFVTSNGYNSYLFRLPYRGLQLTFYATEIYALSSVPVGEALEELPVISVISNESAPTDKTVTFDFDIGTYIILDFPIQYLANFNFKTDVNGKYKSKRLELDSVQDTFARYSERETANTAYGNAKLSIEKIAGKLINYSTGGLTSNASYDTYAFEVPVAELSITCANGFRAVIDYKHPSDITVNGYVKTKLYEYSSGRVNTFTAHYGDYVVISVDSSSDINIKTNYIEYFELPTLKFSYKQSNAFYKYEAVGNAKYLYIFMKSGNKYVRWQLHNVPASASNSNTWQIGQVVGLDENLENPVTLISGGEFELAFKEYGATDYCGGNNHGDENTDSFSLFIDGKTADFSNLDNNYHVFNRIDAIEEATVNRCDTPDEDILRHQKMWIFENGKVKVKQTLKYLEEIKADFLCCMCAAVRSVFPYGARQGAVAIENMTTTTFDRVHTYGNEMSYLYYGTNATCKVTARTCDHTPPSDLWINNAAEVNKLYYDFFESYQTKEAGTVLWWEQEYDVAYN